VELSLALDAVRPRHQGVLGTIRRDGRPQLSNIAYAMDAEGIARISVTEGRAKTQNLRRDPRAVLYVVGDTFWQYVVLDGTAELAPVTTDPADATADELVALYRAVRGEDHPDWDEFRAAMVTERRLVARFRPASAVGILGR
jgi:PPOX class probable F420-dependent enzyme